MYIKLVSFPSTLCKKSMKMQKLKLILILDSKSYILFTFLSFMEDRNRANCPFIEPYILQLVTNSTISVYISWQKITYFFYTCSHDIGVFSRWFFRNFFYEKLKALECREMIMDRFSMPVRKFFFLQIFAYPYYNNTCCFTYKERILQVGKVAPSSAHIGPWEILGKNW